MAAAFPMCQRSKCKNGIVLKDKGIQLRKELSLVHQTLHLICFITYMGTSATWCPWWTLTAKQLTFQPPLLHPQKLLADLLHKESQRKLIMSSISGHTEEPNRYNRNLTWPFPRTWAPKQDSRAGKCVTSKSFEELNTNYSWLKSTAMILLGLTPIQTAVPLVIKDVFTYFVQCQACCTKL